MAQRLDYLKESPSQTAGPYDHIGTNPNWVEITGVWRDDLGLVLVEVEGALQIEGKSLVRHTQLDSEVLAKNADVKPDEGLQWLLRGLVGLWCCAAAAVCHVTRLSALPAVTRLCVVGKYIFS